MKVKDKLKYIDWDLMVLLLFVATIGIIVYKDFFFLKNLYIYLDIGVDTYNQYWPYLSYLSNMIYSGSFSFWSFSIGIGTSMFSASPLLTDPFDIFATLWGPKLLVYVLPYIALSKIMLSALGFYKYLNYLKLNKRAIFITSLLYAYNGYIILWGQHYHFGAVIVFAPFVLWGFEKWIRERKPILYILSLFLIAFSGYYFLYMFAIFFIIYVLIRYFEIYKFALRHFCIYILKIASISILAIGLSSFVLLPSMFVALTNQRVSIQFMHDGMFNFAGVLDYVTMILRLFSNDILGTGNQFYGWGNYYEAPILYTGTISLLLIPLFFLYSNKKEKIIYGILTFALVLFLVFPFFSFFFNAFSAYSLRWTFIIILFMNIINAKSLHYIIESRFKVEKSKLSFIIFLIIFLGMTSLMIGNDLLNWGTNFTHSFKHLFVSFILIIIYAVFVRNINRKIYRKALVTLICIELTAFSYISVNREMLSPNNLNSRIGYNDYTIEALNYINSIDTDLFRIDKSYNSGYLTDAAFQGYNGVKAYSSLNNPSYVNFLRSINIPFKILDHPNFLTGLDSNTTIARLLGVKYLLVNNSAVVPNGYELQGEVANVKVYRDKYFLPLGFAYSNVVPLENFQEYNSTAEKGQVLLKAFISTDKTDLSKYKKLNNERNDKLVRDVIIHEDDTSLVNIDPLVGNLQSSFTFNAVNDDPQIIVPLSSTLEDNQKLKLSMNITSTMASQAQVFFDVDSEFNEENSITFSYNEGETHIERTFDYSDINQLRIDVSNVPGQFTISDLKVQVLRNESLNDLKKLKNNSLNILEHSNDHVRGNIVVNEPMKLFVSIPYDKGWKAKVNGQNAKISNINNGFIGIDLSSGRNEIELNFVPPLWKLGNMLSTISLGIIILLIAFLKRRVKTEPSSKKKNE